MRPSAKSLICGEHWSGGASQRFASLVSGCALLVRVFSVVHSVLHVDVYRYAGVQDTVNVRDILIKEGYAELAEEPYESKVCTFICPCWSACGHVCMGGWCLVWGGSREAGCCFPLTEG